MKTSIGMILVLSSFLTMGLNHAWAEERFVDGGIGGAAMASGRTLTQQDKEFLIDLARKAISQYLEGGSRIEISAEDKTPALLEKKGCFVTLTIEGILRGCIGCIYPQESLCDCVASNAINAAVRDHRFPPLRTKNELDTLDIEISVLSVPEKLVASSADELLGALTPGKDGVILRQGWRQSTYLPQVWDHFPEKKDFLRSLCQKGGMSSNCWEDSDTEIFVYRVEAFHEKRR